MLLRQLWCESTIGYAGKLPTILGSGQNMTLNFGGSKGKPPILFAPFPMSAIRQLRNKISKCKIYPPQYGHQGMIDCKKKIHNQSKIAHVGEAHCTIEAFRIKEALNNLQRQHKTNSPIEALTKSGLFNKQGHGIRFPMRVKSNPDGGPDILIVHSYAYADDWDSPESGLPIAIGAKIEAPLWEKVHEIIGTNPYPKLPNGDTYIPHITIGYMHAQTERPTPEAEQESPADIRQQMRRSYEGTQEKIPKASETATGQPAQNTARRRSPKLTNS